MTTASKNRKSELYVTLKANHRQILALARSAEACSADPGPGSQLVQMSMAPLEVSGIVLVFTSNGSAQTRTPTPLSACMSGTRQLHFQ